MKKIIFSMFLPLLISACSGDKNHYTMIAGSDDTSYLADVKGCPKIHIRQKDAVIIQSEASQKLFEIKADGYQGYCWFNDKTGKNKAVVQPRFKISRLSQSDVTDVHFSYYLETAEGPDQFLGKKTFFAEAKLAGNEKELIFTDQKREMIIPEPGTYNLDIYLGLYARKADSESKN